ncbi:DUF4279 domain-containing protein [Rhizorhabdus argentea]|uniref:DUF4279 domain-containing protein n=1 Tax=Rhizorhabdus argentea TaxID=1387174 RepID=UPI0030EF2CB5
MAELHKTVTTLRLFGDDLDPDEITARLRCVPTVGAKKGGGWLTTGGTEKVARTGFWRLEVKDQQPGDLDVQVAELLALCSDDLSAWADLTARFTVDIFCGLFMEESNEGTTLSAETMKELGLRNLPLDLDIYGWTLPD